MATMRDIISRGYRKLGITGADSAMSADEAEEGLIALNGMLFEWELRGVDTSHTELGMNDTFPLTAAFEDGTAYMLASRLSPDFVVPQQFDADDFFRAVQAAYLVIASASMPLAVTNVPSRAAREGTLGLDG